MKAIVTKYHPATARRGSRISARAEGGARPHRVSIPFPHDAREPHAAAAYSLAAHLGWSGKWVGGGLPDGKGDAFVCVEWGCPLEVRGWFGASAEGSK